MATYRPYSPHEHEWGPWSVNVCLGERMDGSWGEMFIRYCRLCDRADKKAGGTDDR